MFRKFCCHIVFLMILFTASTSYAGDKIIVLLDWFLNPGHAPLFVAEEKGFFKEQQLEVDIIGPADPTDPPKLVAAGKADIAITYEPQFMQQVDQGLPLIRIGSLINHPLNCLAVLKDGPIHSIKDLKGKRIGNSVGSVDGVILKNMLEKNGLSLSDIESINVHYDLSQALLSKQVDAVTGMMRTFEVIQMELNQHPVTTFYPEDNGIPQYEELIFIANKNHINIKQLQGFLKAVKKANVYLQKHPEEMWQAFAKKHPELDNTLNRRAWFASLPYFASEPAALNKKQWETFAAFMKKNNLIKQAEPVNTYAIDLNKEQ